MTAEQVRWAWAPITKREKQDDGSLIVTGVAAGPDLDRDGQGMDSSWLATAVPEWFGTSGNVREQHDPKRAVGRGVGLALDGSNHMLAAHIVDPISVAKVEADVLQGYSVGIKNPIVTFGDPKFPNGTIVGGSIMEVSLVDRPSNPNCLLTVAKADSADDLALVDDQHFEDLSAKNIATRKSAEAVSSAVTELLAKADIPAPTTDDEPSQIDSAKAALAVIAKLIQGEASSLAEGNLNESWDIELLLDAVEALRFFINSEQCEIEEQAMSTKADKPEGETPTPVVKPDEQVDANKADDVTKADTVSDADPQVVKLDELVKSEGFANALTEIVTAAQKPLLDRLEKIEGTPLPGGPVIARTATDAANARETDAAALRSQADELMTKAEQATDRTLQQGYRERAAELYKQAE